MLAVNPVAIKYKFFASDKPLLTVSNDFVVENQYVVHTAINLFNIVHFVSKLRLIVRRYFQTTQKTNFIILLAVWY